MQGVFTTAGENVLFESGPGWAGDLIVDSVGDSIGFGEPSLHVVVERDRKPFPADEWEPLGRGVARQGHDVLISDAAQSGFDLLVRPVGARPQFVFRWRPRAETQLLRAAPARFRLRLCAALTQYPAIWRATTLGRAPLHAACFELEHGMALVTGTPGAGKSTALAAEAAAGRHTVSDNLCVADANTVWGVVEPFRMEGGGAGAGARGRRTTHGRVETALPGRLPSSSPDVVVLLHRGIAAGAGDADDGTAARALVTSTYACGELRRFWPFAALLAMATGMGPAIPPVLQVARALTHRLPCVDVTLDRPGALVSHVLANQGDGRPRLPATAGIAG